MKEFNVEILGSMWEVQLRNEYEDKRLKDCSGFTDWTSRTIVVMDSRNDGNLKRMDVYMMKVLRHEVVHAFMFESGLGDDWEHGIIGQEETVVDWIAYQIPKIYAAVAEAEGKLRVMLNDGN